MKLEDAKETYDVMKVRAGEAEQTVVSGYDMKGGAGGYVDNLSARTEKVSRLAIEDLVDQDPGEGFVMFRNTVQPIKMFYADPVEVDQAELNKFVMVKPPSKKVIKNMGLVNDRLIKLFNDEMVVDEDSPLTNDDTISDCIGDYLGLRAINESANESAIAAIGLVEVRDSYRDKIIIRKVKEVLKPEEPVKPEEETVSTPAVENKVEAEKSEGVIEIIDESSSVTGNSASSSPASTTSIIDVFSDSAESSNDLFGSNGDVSITDQIRSIDKSVGNTDSGISSLELINEFSDDASSYPQNRVGKKMDKESINQSIVSLLKKINGDK